MTATLRRTIVLTALVTLAALAAPLVATPTARAAEPATRAEILASIGDAFADVTGATAMQVAAAADDARDALGSTAFDDVDGIDLDGDRDVDARDATIADYILIAQHEGWIEGYGDGAFGPLDTLRRAPTATIYAALLGVDVRQPTADVLYGDVTDDNVHGCNLHTLSDLDRDGRYSWDGPPEDVGPFVINGYLPRPGENFPDLFGPWDEVTTWQLEWKLTKRAITAATAFTAEPYFPYTSLCDDHPADADRTAIEVFSEISARGD